MEAPAVMATATGIDDLSDAPAVLDEEQSPIDEPISDAFADRESAAVRAGAIVACDEATASARPEVTGQGRASTRAGFRALGERERYVGGFLRLVTGTFVGPDGFIFDRDIVRHPGAVVVVPLEDDGRHVLCVRQFRAAVGESLLELPAGKLDVSDEPPIDCAYRELAEEVGVKATTMTELCSIYNSPGFTDERSHIFLAEGLVPCERDAQGVEESHMTVERIDLDEVEAMISDGRLINANAVVGLTVAIQALRARQLRST
jgi:ADP-ribose pyrophosphatase